jgi:hypothetical protein
MAGTMWSWATKYCSPKKRRAGSRNRLRSSLPRLPSLIGQARLTDRAYTCNSPFRRDLRGECEEPLEAVVERMRAGVAARDSLRQTGLGQGRGGGAWGPRTKFTVGSSAAAMPSKCSVRPHGLLALLPRSVPRTSRPPPKIVLVMALANRHGVSLPHTPPLACLGMEITSGGATSLTTHSDQVRSTFERRKEKRRL